MDLVLEPEQVAAVNQDAVGNPEPFVEPLGRIGRRAELAAPHESGMTLAREGGHAA